MLNFNQHLSITSIDTGLSSSSAPLELAHPTCLRASTRWLASADFVEKKKKKKGQINQPANSSVLLKGKRQGLGRGRPGHFKVAIRRMALKALTQLMEGPLAPNV